jgi:nitrous oxide-stimulated promoter
MRGDELSVNEGKIEKKRNNEIRSVTQMIEYHCRKKHKDSYNNSLCDECKSLLDYACSRTKRCPFMESKTFCNNCKVHCYSPEMRKRIKEVMRFSGPRMMLYHPVMCIKHAVLGLKKK